MALEGLCLGGFCASPCHSSLHSELRFKQTNKNKLNPDPNTSNQSPPALSCTMNFCVSVLPFCFPYRRTDLAPVFFLSLCGECGYTATEEAPRTFKCFLVGLGDTSCCTKVGWGGMGEWALVFKGPIPASLPSTPWVKFGSIKVFSGLFYHPISERMKMAYLFREKSVERA